MKFDYSKILLFTGKIFLFISLGLLLFCPAPAAQAEWDLPDLQIKISDKIIFSAPGACPDEPGKVCVPWIAEYIAGIYKYVIGLVGILATVVMMWGGVVWITAAGNTERISSAKTWVSASLTGLVLALASYTVLYTINPDLVKFKPLKIEVVKEIPPEPAGNAQPPSCGWEKYPCANGKDNAVSVLDISYASVCSKEDKSDEGLICCCNFGGSYSYDVFIYSQINDADATLKKLLSDMRKILPVGVGTISSISDTNDDSEEHESLFKQCQTNYSKPPCEHAENSCHYGGGTAYGSLAVDFGDEQYSAIIKKAASICNAGYILDEGDHVHISTASCKHN